MYRIIGYDCDWSSVGPLQADEVDRPLHGPQWILSQIDAPVYIERPPVGVGPRFTETDPELSRLKSISGLFNRL